MSVKADPDERAIRLLIATWHDATAEGDVARIRPLMAEDVIFLNAGHPPMRGRAPFCDTLTGLFAKMRVVSSAEIKELEISTHLAYAWTELHVTITPRDGGAPVERRGPALTVLRKQPDGRWVVYRDANLLT